MRARRVGRADIRVTELGFGGASIGNLYRATSDEVAREAVDAAWAAGIRYFDTAPHYGLGLSERRLGEALRRYPRDEYVLSTKVGRLIVPNLTPTGSDLPYGLFDVPDDLTRRLDYSADGVRRSLEASLARLGLDRVDVVLMHDPDDFLDETIAEALPALAELREQGVIGAIGVGMNQWEAPLRVVREADIDVVMLAGRWTLLDRTGEALLDACLERGDVGAGRRTVQLRPPRARPAGRHGQLRLRSARRIAGRTRPGPRRHRVRARDHAADRRDTVPVDPPGGLVGRGRHARRRPGELDRDPLAGIRRPGRVEPALRRRRDSSLSR
jgi:hypothetical protein